MKQVTLIRPVPEHKRLALGMDRLRAALEQAGYTVQECADPAEALGTTVFAGIRGESDYLSSLESSELLLYHTNPPSGEGFYLADCPGGPFVISGGSATGALYGCLELADRVAQEGELPRGLAFGDAPAYQLRGPAIGLQKTKVEPPRLTYEYPITPERFPWFYDRSLWEDVMEMMLRERCNVLYLWTGHPFSSLVKVPDYPEAVEVTDEEFQKNKELFGWLTEECDRRGIWVVLKFYSIHIPLPFAQKHGLELLQNHIEPLVADYTRKSIAEFIKSFPNIGLMVCLGEALRGNQNKVDWCCKTILPGIRDGIALAGLKEEPPVIIRAHDCDPQAVMKEAVKQYNNLYTMWKYNGEGLTCWTPRGGWQKQHQDLAPLGKAHILNVHILADLEPFRYGAPNFIQKCMQAGRDRLGGNGLHLYPLFFWDWPFSPDRTNPRLRQLERDWLWYAAWFRYAWNPDRDPQLERIYWQNILSKHYSCGAEGAKALLTAYEASGECAPRLLRRIGITEGNRQTLSLGMTMSQLTNARRYSPNGELWKSVAPNGERPDDYVEKELRGEAHCGETPVSMLEDVLHYAEKAKAAMDLAAPLVTDNREEFLLLASDITAIFQMVHSYDAKVRAAQLILTYKKTMKPDLSGNTALLEQAVPLLEESLSWYRKLAALTDGTYLYANSMQTPQRKIPFPNGETYGHWTQCLHEYEKELSSLKRHVAEIKQGILPRLESPAESQAIPLPSAQFRVCSPGCETFELRKGVSVFRDGDCPIQNCAGELLGLTGVRFGLGDAIQRGVSVKLELVEDSRILVGYFNANGPEWLQVPRLETNTHADDRGGLAPVLVNAMKAASLPTINVHALTYEKGVHELFLGTGAYLVLGVIPAAAPLNPRNAEMERESLESLDWLYEE